MPGQHAVTADPDHRAGLVTASAVRSLPIRVAPLPGEALDSWLQAIAVRHTISLRDVYHHLGLGEVRDLRTRFTGASVSGDDAARIAAATGVTTAQVQDRTLAGFLAVTPRHLSQGWRFCPHCLRAHDGRWVLSWRLIWSFACLQHRCLLAERCPRCGRRQRGTPPVNATPPRPRHCAHPDATATGRSRPRCGADLADTPVLTVAADHPVLRAQQILVDLLTTGRGQFGLYADHPTPVGDILSDIRILGRGIVSATAGHHLDDLLPADLSHHYRQQLQRSTESISASVVTSAAALTAAVTVLATPDLDSAAAPLAALPEEVSRPALHRWTYLDRPDGPPASPVLQAVHVRALGARLSPAEQLRCRSGSMLPHRPTRDARRQQRMLRALPTALWPGWALRITPPALAYPRSRAVLAAAVVVVGNDLDIGAAAALLGEAITRPNALYLLWRFTQSPRWPAIRDALTVLADHLHEQGAPIDYQRRRHLDYRDLLPQQDWDRICRHLGRQQRSAAHTRTYLQHRIAGTLQLHNDPAADETLREFPRRLTPELHRALHQVARTFLVAQGIQDEPVMWEPPMSLLDGLSLPGVDVADVDIGALHRMIRVDGRSLTAISTQWGLSVELLRYALEQHPAPALPPRPRTPRIGAPRPGSVYHRAAQMLPPDRLTALYWGEDRSLADIAALTGFSKPTISRLMRDSAIARRRPGARPSAPVDPDWFYTEYVVHQRSCAELARELHINPQALAAEATRLGIPRRTVAQHTDTDLRGNPNIPQILIPALTGHGGWERLQRFAVIAQFPSLTAAGHHLGRGVANTGSRIARLERDFGTRLLTQKPLRCTVFGDEVLAAIHRLAEAGGP